jgi:hypothetical protein
VVGRVAADDADREGLRDVFGNGQQLRHRLERAAQIILIQTGHDDALAVVRQGIAGGRQVLVEELPFVDPDDFGVGGHCVHQLVGRPHRLRWDPHVAVRHDVVFAVAAVDDRLEDLDLLPGDLRAAQPADQFLALAAEHAAGDDFDPTVVRFLANDIHGGFFCTYSIRPLQRSPTDELAAGFQHGLPSTRRICSRSTNSR